MSLDELIPKYTVKRIEDNAEILRSRSKKYRVGATMSALGTLIFGSLTYAYYHTTGDTQIPQVVMTGVWASLLATTLIGYQKNQKALTGYELILKNK